MSITLALLALLCTLGGDLAAYVGLWLAIAAVLAEGAEDAGKGVER